MHFRAYGRIDFLDDARWSTSNSTPRQHTIDLRLDKIAYECVLRYLQALINTPAAEFQDVHCAVFTTFHSTNLIDSIARHGFS
jgi:hypothetical protein